MRSDFTMPTMPQLTKHAARLAQLIQKSADHAGKGSDVEIAARRRRVCVRGGLGETATR